MFLFVVFTMAIIHYAPKLTKTIPSSLIAIVTMTIIAVALDNSGYHLRTVQDFSGMELKGGLPSFYIPQVNLNLETLQIIFPYAVIAALVGLTEAVLTLRVIDEMTDTRGRSNQEIVAQGLANTANGFFGGMGRRLNDWSVDHKRKVWWSNKIIRTRCIFFIADVYDVWFERYQPYSISCFSRSNVHGGRWYF